jgi:parallel beta-helix repeat protein
MVSAFTLALLISCGFCLFLSIRSVRAVTITVPDDYPTIQAAINAANNGDTIFVRTGTYSENLIANKTLFLNGENRDTTILNKTTIDPLIAITASSVKISSFTLEGSSFKNILVNETTGAIVTGNRILFNAQGIDSENSSNVTIDGNILTGNGLDNIGIMLSNSSERSIVDNTITNAIYDGIRLWVSHDNFLHNNKISNNDYGIFFHGSSQNNVSNNMIAQNTNTGIYIESGSSNNTFVFNDFTDNFNQVGTQNGSTNFWDDSLMGNYWSDYQTRYPQAVGLLPWHTWLTPYVIDANNTDHHPLMDPAAVPEFTQSIIVFLFMGATLVASVVYKKKRATPTRISPGIRTP